MNELGAETESLSQLFDKGLNIHNDVINSSEETNSHTFQDKVKKGILILEDATRLVSILDIFSRNENYSELPTEHVKFFLLPVLLGIYPRIKIIEYSATQQIQNEYSTTQHIQILQFQIIYIFIIKTLK